MKTCCVKSSEKLKQIKSHMNILFLAPLPPPLTGQSLAAKVLFEDLIKRHTIKVVSLNKDSFKQGLSSFSRVFQVIRILMGAWRNRKNVDAIYLTISESLLGNAKDLLIYLICFRNLSKMYIHLHGGTIKKLLWDRHQKLFQINKFFIKKLAGVIISGASHIEIFENIIEHQKIHIVPNFAQDYLMLTEKEIADKFSNTLPLRILYISAMIQLKGYNELLDAYLLLNENLKKLIRIDFVGRFESGAEEKMFLDKIAGIEAIRYHGIVDDDRKKMLFSQAHIFCLPTSFFEGQPISILEAYASGCVVLTTEKSGIRDIFTDGLNGFEIKEKSAGSIASVLQGIIEEDKDLLQIAISNGKTASEKYRTSTHNALLRGIIESSLFEGAPRN